MKSGQADIIRGARAGGCPSALQKEPVAARDPLLSRLDLSAYVNRVNSVDRDIELIVQGAHCAGCLNKIERGMKELPDVTHVRMNLSTLRLRVSWKDDVLSPNDIVTKLVSLGFGAAPYDVSSVQLQSEAELKSLLRAIAVAGFAAMNVMLLSIAVWSGGVDMDGSTRTLFHYLSALIALPTVMYSGRIFFRSAVGALRKKQTNMDVPISLALILASALSVYETVMGNPDTYFDAAVMLLFLLLIGRYLDARLRLRAGEAARQLAALQVTSATRILSDGSIETVPAKIIQPGDMLLIPAGQNIPVDCKVETGGSDIDMQIATGETLPRSVIGGDILYSGMTNLSAPLTVQAIATGSDSFLAEITALVEMGEQQKSKFVQIADRAARAYVPVVHTVALLTFLGWVFVGGDLRVAIINAIAVLIITCPCALSLAVPAVQIVTTGRLFRQGILLRSGDVLERLAKIRSVIFDKTGTLTTGRFQLINAAEILPRRLEAAASLAKYSNHPLAKALHEFTELSPVSKLKEQAGFGLSGEVNGEYIKFGSAEHLGAPELRTSSTEAWLKINDEAPIQFLFEDHIRDDALETIKKLQGLGLEVELLSGDQPAIAKATARDLGITAWRGNVKPKQKLQHIQALKQSASASLMVGDGINDAPALAAAMASVSLATASDISRSTADAILQGDHLSGLPVLIDLARKSQRRVAENLGFAILYNALTIPLAVFGFVNPLIAALAMSGSSLLVTLNALRMSRV